MNNYEIHTVKDFLEFEQIAEQCQTDMFWLIDVQVEPYFDKIEDYFVEDETLIHNFKVLTKSGNEVHTGVRLVPKQYDINLSHDVDEVMGDWKPLERVYAYTVEEALPKAKDYRFAVIPHDATMLLLDTDNYAPVFWDMGDFRYTNYWEEMDGESRPMGCGGVAITSKDYDPSKIKMHDKMGSVRKCYDIIFMSYDEPFADEHYEKLKKRFPRAKRSHGVKGIYQAHKAAARLATTEMFYVVDADAIIEDDFNFDYYPEMWDRDAVHVWKSRNSANGLEYGYGGVKLFPRLAFELADDDGVDVTTTVASKFIIMDQISNVTKVDHDGFIAWKSAFRECCKLSASIIKNAEAQDNLQRLNTWLTTTGGSEYASEIQRGAIAGAEFGKQHTDETEMLRLINDYDWIKRKFYEGLNDRQKSET